MEWIDYGLGGLTTAALAHASPETSELADLYHELASGSLLFGYRANERLFEIGTPQAVTEADAFLRTQQSASSHEA